MLTGIRPAKIVHELMDKGCSKEEINSTLKEYYFVSDKKSEILYNVAKKESIYWITVNRHGGSLHWHSFLHHPLPLLLFYFQSDKKI